MTARDNTPGSPTLFGGPFGRVEAAHLLAPVPVADDNVGSRRVLEKCGFVVYGKGRAYSRPRGGQVDELFLELERPADAAVAPTGRGEPS